MDINLYKEELKNSIQLNAMFDTQVKNALREFGIPEDVIQRHNFKYG